MNRIEETFKRLKQNKEAALVGFVTAGDPDIATSERIITGMCKSGLDILELGIPFSDPTADGPVIQRSSARALAQGVNIGKVLEMTAVIRKQTPVPIILFSYYNPIHAYGVEKFYHDAVTAGADGVLLVDLPPEESDEMTSQNKGYDLDLIRLVAPTTPAERMKYIAESAKGFLYLVSKTGVTGSDGLDTGDISENMRRLRLCTRLPICVGFGISTAEDVAAVAALADGVVIGSAFERLIEENLDDADLDLLLAKKAKAYKAATMNFS
ncbi:MAG: tryptophan synthase subunit alpha [Deltaproteobacteria bacterium]|nr:tryptophan synthase subunit alpha [Deltaproteobacteria bacterium]